MRSIRIELKKISARAWFFVILAYVGTFIVDAVIISSGQSVYKSNSLVLLRMWMPGIVGLGLSIYFKQYYVFQLLKKIPKIKYVLLAYGVPVFIGLISLGLLAASHITSIGLRTELVEKYHGVVPLLTKILVYAPSVGLIIPLFACMGEEIGWRGFLLSETNNLETSFKRIFNGVIWSIYHWPLILFSDYASSSNRLYSILVFSVFVIFQGVFICWLQEKSKSLWTSATSHAAHNLWIIGIFPAFYAENKSTPFFIGEGGLFLTLAYAGVISAVLYFDRKRI